MRLAAVQYRPPKGKVEEARADLVRLAREAGGRGADLVVFPEMATSGYIWGSRDEVLPHAEVRAGPTFRVLADEARRHEMWVVCGFPEQFVVPGLRNADGSPVRQLFNSAMVIQPNGALATCYRKVLLYDADEVWAVPGRRRPICATVWGPMVPGICMDLNDPSFVGHLRASRARLFAFCTNWIEEGVEVLPYWQERVRGWSGWMVAANRWGAERGTAFCGGSAILAPSGEPLARAERSGDCVLVADVPELITSLG